MCVAQTFEGRYKMDAENYNLGNFTVGILVLTMRMAEHIASNEGFEKKMNKIFSWNICV
jgi:hypothetical protein